eukprot:XP_001699884.1 amino acid transporter [Chlamydomonas reinhardtii]
MKHDAAHEEGLALTGNSPDGPGSEAPVNVNAAKPRRKDMVDDGRTSTSQSTLNLVNCILGAGVLGYPFCFRSCGLVLGTLLMAVSIFASRFSYNLLLYCSQISNKRTYEDLADQAIGRGGRQVVELCTAALNLGCIVAYLNILADVLSAVAGTIIPPGAEPSRNAYIMGVSLFGALPVALLGVSVGFVVLFAVVVVIFSLAPVTAAAAAASPLVLWEPEGLLVAFPVIVFSFTAHPYYLGIFNNLQAATFSRMTKVTNLAMGLSSLLYFIVGVGGYITFRNRTAGDLLRNFGAADVDGIRGAYERAIKLCYGISILGSIPLVILPFYSIMAPLVLGNDLAALTSGGGAGGGGGGGMDGAHGHLANGGGGTGAGGGNGEKSYMPAKRTSSGVSDFVASADQQPGDSGATTVLMESGSASRRFSTKSGAAGGGVGQRRGGGAGGGGGGGGGAGVSHEVDVVDLKLLHSGDRSLDDIELPFGKHAVVVVLVLGTALASAIWMPNVEFIFGLTGATASVLLSYILPALTFIRLTDLNPELLGGGKFKTIAESVRMEWVWRKRKAIALLCFGIVSGITCTDAILGAVKQEAAVVHLAQQLVAHEVVVAETAKVQQKARAAVTAVSAVEMAAKELGQASANATGTFNKLQAAAAQLDAVAGQNATVKSHDRGGLTGLVSGHKQHVAETKALTAVVEALVDVKEEVRKTAVGVSAVIAQLDAAMSQLNLPSANGTSATSGTGTGASSGTGTAASGSGTGTAPVAGSGSGSRPASGSGSGAGASGGGTSARDRAADLAVELGKALGAFSDVAGNATVAGKSLSQVRATAVSTLLALNQTAMVLDRVSLAVEAAKKHNKHDEEVKRAAVAAMQLALNATATSALAMQLTGEALQRSATEEASELLSMLVQVSHDLEKTSAKAKLPKVKRVDSGSNATTVIAGNGTATSGSTGAGSSGGAATAGTATGAGSSTGSSDGGGGSAMVITSGSGAATSSTGSSTTDASSSGTSASAGGSGGTSPTSGEDVKFPLERLGDADGIVRPDAKAPVGSGADKAAEAAGHLEAVIKDLNTKIAAASSTTGTAGAALSGTTNTAGTAAAAAAVAAQAAATAAAAAGGGTGASTSHGTLVLPGAGSTPSSGSSSGGTGAATTTTGAGAGTAGAAGGATGTTIATDSTTSAGTTGTGAAATGGSGAGAVGGGGSSGAGAGAANATSSTALVGGAGGLNVSGIAAALKDAVELTKVKQDEALHEIEESLTKSNTKVAARVVDILKDISENKRGTDAAKVVAGGSTLGSTATAVASGAGSGEILAAAGGEAAAAAAAVGIATGTAVTSRSGDATGSSGGGESGESGLMGLVHKITTDLSAGEGATAVGPIVKVDAEGHLLQEGDDGDGVVGPVVKDKDAAGAAGAESAVAAADSAIGGSESAGATNVDASGGSAEAEAGAKGGKMHLARSRRAARAAASEGNAGGGGEGVHVQQGLHRKLGLEQEDIEQAAG